MPFGKHKGSDVFDLPDDYKLWILKNVTDQVELLAAIRHSLLHPEERMPRNQKELESIIRSVILKMVEEKI